MNLSDSKLLGLLTEAISQSSPSTFGLGARLAGDAPVALHRRYSFMFRYWVQHPNGTKQSILVKIPHDSWMKSLQEAIESDHIRDVVTSEFETMTTIAKAIAASQHPKLDAIQPRALLREFNALVMDEMPIQMLKESLSKVSIMLATRRGWQGFATVLQLSGEWLKTIHEMSSAHTGVFLRELRMLETVEHNLNLLQGSRGLSLGELRKLFIRLYECIKDLEVPLASLHNDYQPGNIYITRAGKVGALDPNWVPSGPIFEDLASMLIYPMTRKPQLLTLGMLFRSTFQTRYERAVLDGYFRNAAVPYPILYFYCAADALEKWRDNEVLLSSGDSRMMRNASWLLKPWIRFYFRQLVNDYLERGLRTIKR
jgi:hypothetical protein